MFLMKNGIIFLLISLVKAFKVQPTLIEVRLIYFIGFAGLAAAFELVFK